MYVLLLHNCNSQHYTGYRWDAATSHKVYTWKRNLRIFKTHQPLTTTKSPALDIVFGQEMCGCISPESSLYRLADYFTAKL